MIIRLEEGENCTNLCPIVSMRVLKVRLLPGRRYRKQDSAGFGFGLSPDGGSGQDLYRQAQ